MTGTQKNNAPLIVLAAGGSGGHIFPAEALARALIARGCRVTLLTDRRGQAFGKGNEDVHVERIDAATLGGGIAGKIKAVIAMAKGYVQARKLLKQLQPATVVGFGGYPSVPGVMAAQHLGIPTVLHEQNAILGKANKLLARKAKKIATSLPSVAGLKDSDELRVVMTGNPVRPAITALRDTPYTPPVKDGEFRIFVMGGSQGATVFSDVVPKALGSLPDALKSRLQVVQQCRPADMDEAGINFEKAGIRAELKTFFSDVPRRLEWCHLMICRSGASTVAEVSAIGRPAVFVPYPYNSDDQQLLNAEVVAEAGGGWVMPQDAFTPEALAARLEPLMSLPETLEKAAAAARTCGRPDAAERLADLVCDTGGLSNGNSGANNSQNAMEAAE